MALDRRHMGGPDELSTNRVKSRHCIVFKKVIFIHHLNWQHQFTYFFLLIAYSYVNIISCKVILKLAFPTHRVDFFLFKDLKFLQLYLKYTIVKSIYFIENATEIFHEWRKVARWSSKKTIVSRWLTWLVKAAGGFRNIWTRQGMFFRSRERSVTAHNENRSSHVNIVQNGAEYNALEC